MFKTIQTLMDRADWVLQLSKVTTRTHLIVFQCTLRRKKFPTHFIRQNKADRQLKHPQRAT